MTCECKTLGYTCKECVFDPLLSAVEIGTKNNIIFYDTDAAVGQISKRLFSLILSNFENYDHYNGDKIVSFILPYSAKYDIDLWESNIFVKKDNIIYAFDIPIKFNSGLDQGNSLNDHFLNICKGSLAINDIDLILIETEKTYYLASF